MQVVMNIMCVFYLLSISTFCTMQCKLSFILKFPVLLSKFSFVGIELSVIGSYKRGRVEFLLA